MDSKPSATTKTTTTTTSRLFVEGKYEVALGVASGPETNELRSVRHSNHRICFFKLEKYEDAVRECTKALELKC
ncbi:hypothetical protein QYF36_018296 [Acer negundo]|nr:hypothetical protein QYF36_018296 [Acer negundo]